MIDVGKALLTVLFALVAHAGANVINDYHDALSGADAGNHERLFPFTGGSRFIQNGVLSLRETRFFGYGLLVAVIPAGLWLTAHSAGGLIWIGLAGLLIAWAYSAPPLQLMARGVGEGAIAGGWLMVVLGTDFVQRGEFAARPLIAGLVSLGTCAGRAVFHGLPATACRCRQAGPARACHQGNHSCRESSWPVDLRRAGAERQALNATAPLFSFRSPYSGRGGG